MTNQLYPLGRQAFLNGGIDWTADTIQVSGIYSTNYTPNFTTDQFYSVIPSNAIVATSSALSSKTSADGVAGAASCSFANVSSTKPPISALVVWKNTGTSSTSPLIAYINVGTGLPVSPNNSSIEIVWSIGADLIFSL